MVGPSVWKGEGKVVWDLHAKEFAYNSQMPYPFEKY